MVKVFPAYTHKDFQQSQQHQSSPSCGNTDTCCTPHQRTNRVHGCSCLLVLFQQHGSPWLKFSLAPPKQPFKPSSWYLTETGLPFGQGVKFKFEALYLKILAFKKAPNNNPTKRAPKTTTPQKPQTTPTHTHTQTLQLETRIQTNSQKEHWRSNQGKRGNQIQKLSVSLCCAISFHRIS